MDARENEAGGKRRREELQDRGIDHRLTPTFLNAATSCATS